MLCWQVDVDLESNRGTFNRLAFKEDDEGVERLREWKTVSSFWPDGPTGPPRLHIFVTLPSYGEYRFPNMNSTDNSLTFHPFPVVFHVLLYHLAYFFPDTRHLPTFSASASHLRSRPDFCFYRHLTLIPSGSYIRRGLALVTIDFRSPSPPPHPPCKHSQCPAFLDLHRPQ